MSTYCSIVEFQKRYDLRAIAQLSDDTNAATINTANVQACLDDAACDIRTAALQGSIYTVAQLDTLLASGDTQLVRLNADLALGYIVGRRVLGLPEELTKQIERATNLLEALRDGKRVLNVDANRPGDVPAMVTSTAEQDGHLFPATRIDFFGGPHATRSVSG